MDGVFLGDAVHFFLLAMTTLATPLASRPATFRIIKFKILRREQRTGERTMCGNGAENWSSR